MYHSRTSIEVKVSVSFFFKQYPALQPRHNTKPSLSLFLQTTDYRLRYMFVT